jgi:RNA polymerase sigma factor (sigma-70 family)
LASVKGFPPAFPRRARLRRSFADVAKDYLDDVFRYLLLLTGDRSLAEDLTAAAFEKAFRRWKSFDPRRGSELAWLCRIGRSVAFDHFRAEARRRRREELYARDFLAWDEPPLESGFSTEIEAALQSLTAGEREIIALRIVLDLDADTAAGLLGASRTACSMRLSRALTKLQERMEAHAYA